MSNLEKSNWNHFLDEEQTIRPKKNTAIKRIQTFAAADGLRYMASGNRKRRNKADKFRYTVPVYPPLSSASDGELDSEPINLHVRTSSELFHDTFGRVKKESAVSGDRIYHLSTVLPLPDQFSPGARSASSGFGSTGLAWSDLSFRSTARSLTAASPDSAISLFSSSPSKIGSIIASKKAIHLDSDLIEECQPTELPRLLTLSRIHYAPRFIERASETTYVTTVFELLGKGLQDIVPSIGAEMRQFSNQGLMIACCEVRWSTPDQYRDIGSETQLKDDVLESLRVNNTRIWDAFDSKSKSITEELVARKWECTSGSYRRYYSNLLPLAHTETAQEHEPWWQLRKGIELDNNIDWPLIATRQKTSVVMLNMICLKM